MGNDDDYSPVYSFRDGHYRKCGIPIDPITEMIELGGQLEATHTKLAEAMDLLQHARDEAWVRGGEAWHWRGSPYLNREWYEKVKEVCGDT